jgi:hypothetical protein
MDVVLSILVGLTAGLAVALVLPAMGPPSRTDSARRRVRAMATGGVGGVAAGYGMSLVESSLRADGLVTTLASLAGALWLAGIVEVFSSRRRAGEDRQPSTTEAARSPAPIDMPAYDAARQVLVAGLIEDARAHEAGQYAGIGRGLPAIRDTLSREDPAWPLRLRLAVRFWGGWTEARDDRWNETGVAKPITAADWPRFARIIASDLALDRDTMEPTIVTRFG